MFINNTSHLIYPIRRSNNRKLFIGNTKFTLGRTKIANFNSAKTFKIANSQTLISANISSFTVLPQIENFLKYFFSIMFTSKLIKTQYLRIISKNKAVFHLFCLLHNFMRYSIILWNSASSHSN